MNQSLNDLFSALMNSEKAAEEEKAKYVAAKKNIEIISGALQKENAKKQQLTEEIIALEKGLACAKTSKTYVTLKEEVLRDKVGTVRADNLEVTDKVRRSRDHLVSEKMAFMSRVRDFTEHYGLLVKKSKETRLENARSMVKKIYVEVETVENEIKEKKSVLTQVRKELEKKADLLKIIEQMNSDVKRTKDQIGEEEVLAEQLNSEYLELQAGPENSEEFKQVTHDLAQYDTVELETNAQSIHAQLAQVSAALRQRESRSLQQQFRQWQRQRQQQGLCSHHHQQQQQYHQQQQQQQQQQHPRSIDNSENDGAYSGFCDLATSEDVVMTDDENEPIASIIKPSLGRTSMGESLKDTSGYRPLGSTTSGVQGDKQGISCTPIGLVEPFVVKETSNQLAETSNRFDETSNRFTETSNQFTENSDRFAETSNRFAETSNRFAETSNRFDETSNRFTDTSNRFAGNRDQFNETDTEIDGASDSIIMGSGSGEVGTYETECISQSGPQDDCCIILTDDTASQMEENDLDKTGSLFSSEGSSTDWHQIEISPGPLSVQPKSPDISIMGEQPARQSPLNPGLTRATEIRGAEGALVDRGVAFSEGIAEAEDGTCSGEVMASGNCPESDDVVLLSDSSAQ